MKAQFLKRFFTHLSPQHLKWFTSFVLILFVVDLFVPDALPFLDELGLGWVLIELFQESNDRKKGKRENVIDVD